MLYHRRHFWFQNFPSPYLWRSYSAFLPLPSPWQLSLWICLFWIFHQSGIITTQDLLCLASFTERNDSEVHPLCSRCLHVIPFLSLSNTPSCGFITFCFSVHQWIFGLFPPSSYSEWCCHERCCESFCWKLVWSCLPLLHSPFGQNKLLEDKSNLLIPFLNLRWLPCLVG